jgi:hypothetical protein
MSTHAWVCQNGGRLTAEQKSTARAGIRAGYGDIAKGLARWPFAGAKPAFALPQAPDSRVARAAVEAAATQGPVLTGHGYRTWILGSALAAVDGITVDPELLFVTGLLHDSGMATEVVGEDFTRRSGDTILAAFEDAGEPPERASAAADAAVAHATPGLTAAENPIGHYVQAGALADLAGLRMWDLPRGILRASYLAHPSHRVHATISALIRREARQVPDGRFALLRRAGMDLMVAGSPTRWHAR